MISISSKQGSTGAREFEIKLSAPGTGWRSQTFTAKTMPAVFAALRHYYCEPSHHDGGRKRGCPLCQRAEGGVMRTSIEEVYK